VERLAHLSAPTGPIGLKATSKEGWRERFSPAGPGQNEEFYQ
jgi:hypothetical protein